MKQLVILALLGVFVLPTLVSAETLRLKSTADIWLSDATPEERNSSAGQVRQFKLKSIQEMAAIRFDAAPVKGKEVLSAKLFLHKAGKDMLRYIRVSTVNQDWVEGNSNRPYGPADGATYRWADAKHKKAWSYPGSEFADIVMGMGHTITTYAEHKQELNDWISLLLTPELIYALVAENTDGLAVMDGGTPSLFNNFIHSMQAGGNAPYIEVVVGKSLFKVPAKPQATAEPSPDHAHMSTGAIQVSIQQDPEVFCWKLQLNGKPVPRWQVPYPPAVQETGREQEHIKSGRHKRSGPVVFYLDDLEPQKSYTLEVVAIARGGAVSSATQLTVQSSPARRDTVQLGKLEEPNGSLSPIKGGSHFAVWPVPGLVKISPETTVAMFKDIARDGRNSTPNPVWDGQTMQLFGGRGEYVSYQLVIKRLDLNKLLANVRVLPSELKNADSSIGGREIELFKNWYAKNQKGQWQPAYCIPWEHGQTFEIPDPQRGIGNQQNQTVYVDIYIPKHASTGTYTGTVTVEAGHDQATLPVQLQVYDFALPDQLSFWPELNSYVVPNHLLDYHRLAHQHRLVFNPWVVRPQLQGAGKDLHVQWDQYDKAVGPLLSGEAFQSNRRAGVPTPVMYLPFEDSWPTPLNRQTYDYAGHWPGRGEDKQHLTNHSMTAPYIGDGLSQSYKDAFLAVQKQFIEHFQTQGWNQTEMQLFFGGKNTHRIDYGANMWWNTDEPYHWEDWLALQFFCHLWSQGRHALGADPRLWAARADVSWPMWMGRVLDTIVDRVYWGGFNNPRWYRRAEWLAENTGLTNMAYGSTNPGTTSNTQTVATLMQVWLHGSNGSMPWQTLGDDHSLDHNDNVEGSALLVPGKRFGIPVVGDMRLKALRDGQQIIEYLVLLAARYQLQREQVHAMLLKVIPFPTDRVAEAELDNAEAMRFSTLKPWQIAALRLKLAELISNKQP